jgi:hypothetical protein
MFPLMSPDELKALGEDIKKNGQRQPIAIIERARRRPDGTLHVKDPPLQEVLDGRSRLDAMQLADIKIIREDGQLDDHIQRVVVDTDEIDPVAFVISCNIHRRHLTAEQKRELIAKLIKATPEKSDRQIAETVKADHKTVGSVRTQMEGRGEIPHVETRTDTRGRKQRARKPRTRNMGRLDIIRRQKLGDETFDKLEGTTLATAAEMDELIRLNCGAPEGGHTESVKQLVAAAVAGESVSAVNYTQTGAAYRGEDIAAAKPNIVPDDNAPAVSVADVVVRIGKIAHEIISLNASCELGNKVPSHVLLLMGEASVAWAELTKRLAARVEIKTAPPDDDGLDIPDCLRRDKPKEMTP